MKFVSIPSPKRYEYMIYIHIHISSVLMVGLKHYFKKLLEHLDYITSMLYCTEPCFVFCAAPWKHVVLSTLCNRTTVGTPLESNLVHVQNVFHSYPLHWLLFYSAQISSVHLPLHLCPLRFGSLQAGGVWAQQEVTPASPHRPLLQQQFPGHRLCPVTNQRDRWQQDPHC